MTVITHYWGLYAQGRGMNGALGRLGRFGNLAGFRGELCSELEH